MFTLRVHGYITTLILIALLALTGVWYAAAPLVYGNFSPLAPLFQEPKQPEPLYSGNYVVADVNKMELHLKNGTTTLHTFPILSIGKPGSYYETIGGAHENDYKIRKHFSSIGHVYMPWSVHVFGNFFIHGIPYYEDGTPVSSTYSGGCIRLSNEHAQLVYEFVEKGTPILITEGTERDFIPTTTASSTILSVDMTRLMVAVVSLEILTQDNEIYDQNGNATTRKRLLPRLLTEGDDSVSKILAKARGEATYIDYMNTKAKALGMTNTHFSSLADPVATTREDIDRFNSYIVEYKPYLLTIVPEQE